MKFLRSLLALPVIIVLGLVAAVLAFPMFLYLGAVQLYIEILKVLCWANGNHIYDVYGALLVEDLSQMRCNQCKTLIPKSDIPALTEQKEALAHHIDKMAEHLRTSKENTEITTELSKLE